MRTRSGSRNPLVLLVIPFFLGIAGCDSNGPDGLAGTYDLATVDGNSLPALFIISVGEFTIESGSLDLDSDGTFDFSFSGFSDPLGPSGPSDFDESNSGTYAVSGNSVSFTGAQGNFHGTVDGSAIESIILVNGLFLTFRLSP